MPIAVLVLFLLATLNCANFQATPEMFGTAPDGDGQTSSYENPNPQGHPFDNGRNAALSDAEAIGAVEWHISPQIAALGELMAEGSLAQGAALFNPMAGDGAAFAVFYKGHTEPMVYLLPDLGPMWTWETFETVAPTEVTSEGPRFTLRAHSPLFWDVGPDSLELRVYGTDAGGADTLLDVRTIAVGQ